MKGLLILTLFAIFRYLFIFTFISILLAKNKKANKQTNSTKEGVA